MLEADSNFPIGFSFLGKTFVLNPKLNVEKIGSLLDDSSLLNRFHVSSKDVYYETIIILLLNGKA